MLDRKRVNSLYQKYLNQKASSEETKELFQIIEKSSEEELGSLVDSGLSTKISEEKPSINERERLDRIFQEVLKEQTPPVKSNTHLLQSFLKYGIAASILLSIGLGYYFHANNTNNPTDTLLLTNDVEPGGNKATLTLADGRIINLNDLKEGIIIDASDIKYNDGTLLRNGTSSDAEQIHIEPQYATNVIATPRGGQYQVSLPDGTRVWLNSASRLKFPATFNEKNRTVELEGEAYFEVKKNPGVPFQVKTNKDIIEVLGTQFNVNAYPDENASRTTLLEGKVKVSMVGSNNKMTQSNTLSPGEQNVTSQGEMDKTKINVAAAVAWKNGEFMFNKEDIKSVMLKIARWYDVEVIYPKEKLEDVVIWGSVSRYDHIEKVLHIIEMTGSVRFEIKGRKVYVMK